MFKFLRAKTFAGCHDKKPNQRSIDFHKNNFWATFENNYLNFI